jgi:serine/threonine protein kinase
MPEPQRCDAADNFGCAGASWRSAESITIWKNLSNRSECRVTSPAPQRFVFQHVLGKGASGTVYRAVDTERGTTVAVKVLTSLDPLSLFHFKSEFRTLANLSHPNLLRLHELLTVGDDWLLTMELVEGTDFLGYVRPLVAAGESPDPGAVETRDWDTTSDNVALSAASGSGSVPAVELKSQKQPRQLGSLDAARLRSALRQLAEGLQALHLGDRLHRDLKPANVLVFTDGRVVICDFGLALEGTRRRPQKEGAGTPAPTAYQSSTDTIAGTLPFMSPEQAAADMLTTAADWYSVGVMLYQALTGGFPVNPELPYLEALRAKREQEPTDPVELNPSAPPDLAQLALNLLKADASERAGYREIVETLEARTRTARG